MSFTGVIIEESLENTKFLSSLNIIKTQVEPVTPNHKTPWIKQWTLHTVKVSNEHIEELAQDISQALDPDHAWYADFKDENTHYIIFRNKVFKVDRTQKDQYDAVTAYGVTLGIPEYQLDFSPYIQAWQR